MYDLLFMCFILIIFGCADKQNRYGINFNDQRSIIKLPLLDSSWKYSPSYTSEGGTWVNPQKKDGVPCYFQKRNLIKNNRIIWESDIYLGGKTYTTIDGSIRESLTVTYYFEKKKWEYVYHTAKRNYNSSKTALLKLKIYIIALISYYQSVKRTLYSSLGIYDWIVDRDNYVNVIEYDYLGSAKERVRHLNCVIGFISLGA